MSEQVVPSAVAQRIVVKFLTNKNMKSAEIPLREYSSVMKLCQGPTCMTGVIQLNKAGQRMKICEDYTFCREGYG
jgi:hypothetical protein